MLVTFILFLLLLKCLMTGNVTACIIKIPMLVFRCNMTLPRNLVRSFCSQGTLFAHLLTSPCMVTLQSTSKCCKADLLYVGTGVSTKTSVSCLVPAEVSLWPWNVPDLKECFCCIKFNWNLFPSSVWWDRWRVSCKRK